MFYIRTADRLERTAPWLARLEGALDHLRAVLLDDSLGICADLDELMGRHVSTYQDEWAATLADPERLRRFVSFTNAPDTPDPTVRFVPERNQIRLRPRRGRPHPAAGARTADRRPLPGGTHPMTLAEQPTHQQTTVPQVEIHDGRRWTHVCALADLTPGRGAALLVCGQQIAAFRDRAGRLYALDNRDPSAAPTSWPAVCSAAEARCPS